MTDEYPYIHPQLRALALPIDSLTPDPKNARSHDRRNLDTIKASLLRFGMRSAIVAQRQGEALVVRAGNGRLTAAQELGWTHLPVLIFEESDNDAVAYAIVDNRSAELAEWDYAALDLHLSTLAGALDIGLLGWTQDEKNSLHALTLDGFHDAPAVGSKREEVAPDAIESYDESTDFYLVKIENVPPGLKDIVVEAVNAALSRVGGGLVARAY